MNSNSKSVSSALVVIGCLWISISAFASPTIALVIPLKSKSGVETGKASFYTVSTNGTRTASGEPLKDDVCTAAHRTLPFGTRVKVTNVNNGRSEVVRITDRGPFVKGRVIDVSIAAAKKLDFVGAGLTNVRLEIVK